MSSGKRFWLPTQKGTELFPKTTQAPARLVIRGVPPSSPLHHAVANAYAGRLKSFHAKSQQNYSLSNNQIAKNRFDWGDGASATYTNIQGQEFLELTVSTSVLESLVSETTTSESQPYDWAVIDLHVTPFTHIYTDGADPQTSYPLFIARMVVPNVLDRPEFDVSNPVVPIGGQAGNYSNGSLPVIQPFEYIYSAEASPILQWAPGQVFEIVEQDGGNEIVASLLVDLRSLPTDDDVVIEIYGGLSLISSDANLSLTQNGYYIIQRASTPDELEFGPTPTPATLTADTGRLPPGTPDPFAGSGYHDDSALPGDYPSPYPERGGGFLIDGLTPGTYTSLGDYYAGGMFTVDEPQGGSYDFILTSPNGIRWEFHENVLHYEFYPVNAVITTPYDVPPSGSAQIKAGMIRGDLNWGSSTNIIIGLTYSKWEDATAFPLRFGTAAITKTPIELPIQGGTQPGGVDSLTLLGKLHVLVKLGSVTFEPAA